MAFGGLGRLLKACFPSQQVWSLSATSAMPPGCIYHMATLRHPYGDMYGQVDRTPAFHAGGPYSEVNNVYFMANPFHIARQNQFYILFGK